MHPARRFRADELSQTGLHVHVDVLESFVPGKGAVLDFCPDGLQAGDYLLAFVVADNALSGQHADVDDGAGYVLVVETAVVVYGDGVFADSIVHESPADETLM